MLAAFQHEVARWHYQMFPTATPDDILHKLTEEIGELCREWQRGKWGEYVVQETALAQESDAIGDILIVLAAYCGRRGIDMQEAMVSTWNDVQQRSVARVHNGSEA